MIVLNTLAPVFLIIALGAWLRRRGMLPEPMALWASELTYWIALPALLFVESAAAELSFARHFGLLAVVLGGMLACIAAGYAAARALGLPGTSSSALVQAGFRGNLAFIGIPVIVYSLGEANREGIAVGVLMVAATIPFYNLAAVVVILAGQHRFSGSAVRAVLLRLATNPLILSCGAGLALAWGEVPLPVSIHRTLDSVGTMALPLALLSIGGTLDLKKVHGALSPILTATLIKVVLAPSLGWAAGQAAGLSGEEMRIALILLASPTAAASFVMADQLGSDTHLTAGAIVLSTLLSFISLAVVVALPLT